MLMGIFLSIVIVRRPIFQAEKPEFEEMKKQLLKAEKYIFLEYFIIDEGEMWGEILAILKQKVQEGGGSTCHV